MNTLQRTVIGSADRAFSDAFPLKGLRVDVGVGVWVVVDGVDVLVFVVWVRGVDLGLSARGWCGW